MKNNILKILNPDQREAVLHIKSPLLIIAGAGSGKTKVITNKIAYLIQEKNYSPFNIVGLTFTNKAADEMKERIESITKIDSKLFNISTFHSFGLKILRKSGHVSGFNSEWHIIDDHDQKKIVERIIIENFNHFTNDMRETIIRKINLSKMNLHYPNNPELLLQKGFKQDDLKIYSLYFEYQKKNKLWDYEDLVSLSVKLFQNYKNIRKEYHKKFRYIVVDEFQDTNPNQYELVKLLAEEHKNITIVGDDDQAIYSWRGASIRFLFNFEQDFPGTHILKLERNYRSTQPILNFANNVINKNSFRRSKFMWTKKKDGSLVYLINTKSKEDESKKIAELILKLKEAKPDSFPIAILYRINSQSLTFETEFLKRNIDFRIIKGMRFFDRKEVKDSLALLKLTLNLNDDISFIRAIDFLPVGIGPKTIDSLYKLSKEKKCCLFLTLKNFLSEKFKAKKIFSKIWELNQNQDELKFSEILSSLIESSNYLKYLEDKIEHSRILNIKELIEFIKKWEKNNPKGDFNELIDRISLDKREKKAKNSAPVYLLTMHNAKGLEFPTVILAGINSIYMPFFLRKGQIEIEEERRLLYVASTRAIDQLILSTGSQNQSRFLFDINNSMYTSVYSIEELLNSFIPELKKEKQIPEQEVEEQFIEHPIFGKGKIIDTVDCEKYTVQFLKKGKITIDTSIVPIRFL